MGRGGSTLTRHLPVRFLAVGLLASCWQAERAWVVEEVAEVQLVLDDDGEATAEIGVAVSDRALLPDRPWTSAHHWSASLAVGPGEGSEESDDTVGVLVREGTELHPWARLDGWLPVRVLEDCPVTGRCEDVVTLELRGEPGVEVAVRAHGSVKNTGSWEAPEGLRVETWVEAD